MSFKSLDELVVTKTVTAKANEVSVKTDNKSFTITLPRIDKLSKTGNTMVLAEAGLFKFGQPVEVVLPNGKKVTLKVKATIYMSL